MSAPALRFVNARLPGGGSELFVKDDLIADAAEDAETIDCGGRLLTPAIVDLGVFAVDPAACRFGGITHFALMPDQSPALDDPAALRSAAMGGGADVSVHPIAAATRGLAGVELTELALCKAAGARAIGTGRRWIADSGVMRRVLAYARDLGLPVITHAEDAGLVGDAVATDGETATRLGLPSAPALAEALAIARDVMLAEETGARLHIRQVTTAAGFDLVRAAKARGAPVTCGISPTHLLLSDIAITGFRTAARLSPPLRGEADRQAALAAFADGTIDVLCSGHDPRGAEEKRLPLAESVPGATGAQTLLALALGLVRDGLITIERLFDLLAAAPARILGIDAGVLAPGMPADLILIDPDAPWRIEPERLPGRAGTTPFDGLPVQGRVSRMFKSGRELG